MPGSPASIIVPTFREVANIRPLVERIMAATTAAGIPVEIIVVDDNSCDGTEEAVNDLACNHPVRIIVRREERGLATAVLRGFAEAKYDRFLVLDADLQHPPESIPQLLACLDSTDCEFSVGSRYAGSGAIDENWPLGRRIASKVATMLALPLVSVRDPMSGFFALKRAAWERATKLDPVGYKIALEILVKSGCRNPAEVPISFGERLAGETKFGAKEVGRYLRHLGRLYLYRYPWLPWGMGFVLMIGVVTTVIVAVR